MNKRLRKKLRRGEFTELGFEVLLKTHLDTAEAIHSWVDDLISFTEGRDLGVGGGHISFYVTRYRGSCTEEDRQAYHQWLGSQPIVASWTIAPLSDAWYSKCQEDEHLLPGTLRGSRG